MITASVTDPHVHDQAVQEHREWLSVWRELTAISSGGFTSQGRQLPLTDAQRDAYRAIPDVLDRLRDLWTLMDEGARPLHYLMAV
jgi:hypothetical protein